jgi:hypothetical protein
MAVELRTGLAVAGVLGGVLLAGCAPRATTPAASSPSAAQPSAARASAAPPSAPKNLDDWRNATYRVTCDGLLNGNGLRARLVDGAATVPVDISESPYYTEVDVSLQAVTTGDVDGDGRPDAVVLLECSPQPSNATTQEVHVLRADGSELAVLPSPDSLPQATILPPEYVPTGLTVQNGDVVAAMKSYGPGDSHATGPSVPFTMRWHWTGTGFAPLP